MISVVGAGAIGAALAAHLHRAGRDVRLLATEYDAEAAAAIRSDAPHPGLGRVVPGDVQVVDPDGWAEALGDSDVVVLGVASAGLVATIELAQPSAKPDAVWGIATKGIDERTLRTAAAVAADAIGDESRVVALVGPTLAAEIAAGVPTGIVAASTGAESARLVAELFETPSFRVEVTDDVIGVEVGAGLKNVVAIAAGMCDGLAALEPDGSWKNTQALVFSRGLQEMAATAVAQGGRAETVLGLTGAGDLYVTCVGGRNARYGRMVGEGMEPSEALDRMRTTVEGYQNARAASKLASKHGLDLTVVRAVCSTLFEGTAPRDAIAGIVGAR